MVNVEVVAEINTSARVCLQSCCGTHREAENLPSDCGVQRLRSGSAA